MLSPVIEESPTGGCVSNVLERPWLLADNRLSYSAGHSPWAHKKPATVETLLDNPRLFTHESVFLMHDDNQSMILLGQLVRHMLYP